MAQSWPNFNLCSRVETIIATGPEVRTDLATLTCTSCLEANPKMAPFTEFAVKDKYTYLHGFGSYHEYVVFHGFQIPEADIHQV